MPLTREQKQKVIENLKEKIAGQKIMIFIDFKGLKAKELFNLRKRAREINSRVLVAKKNLIRLVFKEKGVEFKDDKLMGQLAIIFGFGDEISPAKLAYQFSLENPNFKILGGFLENKFSLGNEIITLAQLPSREILLAKLLWGLSAPVSNLVYVLEGNIKGLICVFSQIKSEF